MKKIVMTGALLMVLGMPRSGIQVQAQEIVSRAGLYDRFLTGIIDTLNLVMDENRVVRLADGSYIPDKFGYSGGTGRVTISCQEVMVREGRAYARLVFDSGSYSYVKVNGRIYEGSNTEDTSAFEIPVLLNRNNTVIGCTTKMSSAHEISYNIFVYVEGALDEQSEDGEPSQEEGNRGAPKIEGLTFVRETPAESARLFRIFHYKDEITCIEVDLGTEVIRYLIIPDAAEIPAGLDQEMEVIRRPVEGDGFHAYVASEPVLGWMDDLGQQKSLSICGIPKEECQISDVRKLLREGKVPFGGTYDEIEYKTLVALKCDLALMPSEIISPKEDVGGTEALPGERHETYDEVSGYLSELGIPMFVDGSVMERSQEGQAEWIKVYGVLFDREEEAQALYETWY